jgi:hypothetical protein
MPSSAIKEVFASWEKDGAMAFEDAPGAWSKSTDENGGACLPWLHPLGTPILCAYTHADMQHIASGTLKWTAY